MVRLFPKTLIFAATLFVSVSGAHATVVCTNAPTGDSAIIQRAIDSGRPVDVIGPCHLDAPLVFVTKGQPFGGQGRIATVFSQSSVFPAGTMICKTGEPGPEFHDFEIDFTQPDTNQRAQLIQYNPAFLCRATPRARFSRLRIQRAIVGFDLQGNSGGTIFSDIEESAFGADIIIDGSEDSITIDTLHAWPFGLTPKQQQIFYQIGSNDCFGTSAAGSYGIVAGRADGLLIVGGTIFYKGGPQLCFYPGRGGPDGKPGTQWASGNVLGSMIGGDLDNFAGVVMEQRAGPGGSAAFTMTGTMLTLGVPDACKIAVFGGRVSCVNCYYYSAISSATPMNLVANGALGIVGGIAELGLPGSARADITFAENEGGDLVIDGMIVKRPRGTYSRQVFVCTSAAISCAVPNIREPR